MLFCYNFCFKYIKKHSLCVFQSLFFILFLRRDVNVSKWNKEKPMQVLNHCYSMAQFQRLNTEFLRGGLIYRSAEIAQQPLLPSKLCWWQTVYEELKERPLSAFLIGRFQSNILIVGCLVKLREKGLDLMKPTIVKKIKCLNEQSALWPKYHVVAIEEEAIDNLLAALKWEWKAEIVLLCNNKQAHTVDSGFHENARHQQASVHVQSWTRQFLFPCSFWGFTTQHPPLWNWD